MSIQNSLQARHTALKYTCVLKQLTRSLKKLQSSIKNLQNKRFC